MDLVTSFPTLIVVVMALYGVLGAAVGVCGVLNRRAGRQRFNGWFIGAGLVVVIGGCYLWARSAEVAPGNTRADEFVVVTIVLLIVWPSMWRGIEWRQRAAKHLTTERRDA